MIKKFFILLIILCHITLVYADNLTSNNEFPFLLEEIDIPDTPSETQTLNKNNGLSGNAVTAITLGSIGVVALGAISYFIYQKYFTQGLALGCAVGCKCPIIPICLNKKEVQKLYVKYNKNTLLKKAIEENEIRECPHSKYILIPDTEIKQKTFNTYIFEIPDNRKKAKITIATSNDAQLDYDFINNNTEINLKTIKNDTQNNIKIDECNILNSNISSINIKNLLKDSSSKYAVVIELFY